MDNFQTAVIKTRDKALGEYSSEIADFMERENKRKRQADYEKGLANPEPEEDLER